MLAFGDPAGPRPALGGVAILAGIAMSSVPALRADGRRHALAPAG